MFLLSDITTLIITILYLIENMHAQYATSNSHVQGASSYSDKIILLDISVSVVIN